MTNIPVVVTADLVLPIDESDISGLGTAAYVDVPETGDAAAAEAVLGNDTRLRDNKVYEGVPLKAYGHSYGQAAGNLDSLGRGATSPDSLWPARLAKRMGFYFPYSGTYTRNRTVSGATMASMTPWMLNVQGTRWKPLGQGGADRGIVVIDCVTNDYGYRNVANPLEIAAYQENLRTCLRFLRRSNTYGLVETDNWTTVGTAWGNTIEATSPFPSFQFSPLTESSTSGNIRSSPNLTSYLHRSFVGDEIIISGIRSNYGTGVTANLNIYNYDDDPGLLAPIANFDLANGYGTTVTNHPNFYMATERVAGWGPGTHNVAIRAAVQQCFIDSSWVPCTLTGNDFPPRVFVVVDGVTYQNPPGGHTPEYAMDVWRQAIYDVIYHPDHEFDYYCTMVDMNAAGWDKATMLPSYPTPLIHPNDYGQEFYTNTLESFIRFVVPDYVEGVHIVA